MYQKSLLALSLLLFASLSFSVDLNCSIDKELSKDHFQKLIQLRQQASAACLKCVGKECEMKSWKKEQAGDATVCRLLFCTATSVSRSFKSPDGVKKGRTKIKFNYDISEEGRIKGLRILSTSGKMNDRQAYKYLQSFSRKTSFEPLVIDGKQYGITNLTAEVVANIGIRADINKYNAADSKLWTN
jgi:hypothetical protein|tara:strand:+ start:58 stop:615 length:558 start_codon:yes stop_codon:yes gene_type:complete